MDKATVLSVPATPYDNLLTEAAILKKWQKGNVYQHLLARAETEHYILREVPFSTHEFTFDTLASKIHQDVFLKSKMMQGMGVVYTPAWQYYSVGVERRVKGETSKEVSLDTLALRKRCRRRFQKELELRQQQLCSLGLFGDWESTGKNLDSRYESRLINVFCKLRDLGYVHTDQQLGYWCPTCNTSPDEGHLEQLPAQVNSGYIKFPISTGLEEFGDCVYLAVWLGDLWHMAGSVALGVRERGEYLMTEVHDEIIIFGADDITEHAPKSLQKNIRVLATTTSDSLVDCTCVHPFLGTDLPIVVVPEPRRDEIPPNHKTSTRVADLVYLAPGHCPVDYQMAQALELPIPSVVDDAGRLAEDAELFCGLDVAEAGKFITLDLERRGYLIHAETKQLPQSHCWKCQTPVLFRLVQQWVFSFDNNRLRGRLLGSDDYWDTYDDDSEAWIKGVLQNLSDLCISSHQGWSLPIPVFHCEKCHHQLSSGRVLKAVRDLISRRGTDIWFKLSVDELLPSDTLCPKCESREFQKESTLLNGHFALLLHGVNKSDAKKTSVKHLNVAFASKHQFQKWLAQLIFTSTALHDTFPFKHFELVSMTPHLHPFEINERFLDAYPTDVLRILGVQPNLDLPSIDSEACSRHREYETVRRLLCEVREALADFNPKRHRRSLDVLLPLDALALARTNHLLRLVDDAYQHFRFYNVWCLLRDFCIIDIQGFYMPLLAQRFKVHTTAQRRGDRSGRPDSGQRTLWEIMRVLVQRLAPLTPFLSEQIHTLNDRLDMLYPFETDMSENQASASPSVFFQDWIDQIPLPTIVDADERWKQIQIG